MANEKSFFGNNDKLNPFPDMSKQQQRADQTNRILEFVKKKQPISLWDLEKATRTKHTTLFFIMRDLEFAGIVYSKTKINENNRMVRLYFAADENKKIGDKNEMG